MKYTIYSIIYFLCVVSFIIAFAFFIGLTEENAISIFVIAFVIFLIFSFIYAFKNKCSYKGNNSKAHKLHLGHENHKIPRNKYCIIPIFVLCFVLLSYLSNTSDMNVDIPNNIIEFGNKYPEAEVFVKNYPRWKDKNFDMDITNEVTEGAIPLFLQWDKRWGYKKYGSSFIGVAGCGPTCLSMVICGLTGNLEWNPYNVAKFSEDNGYYIDGQGTSWELMTTGAKQLGLEAEYGIVDESYIHTHLNSDTPMICSMYPGDFTYTGHFIVLTGIDSDGKIIVNDPNSVNNSTIHWNMEKILPQIRSIWSFQKVP